MDRLREGMRSLPAPTEAQYVEFAGHVCAAHGWYKHMPFDGRTTGRGSRRSAADFTKRP